MPSALLFDVGDVLMESNWVVLDELERRTGRRFAGRGAMDPGGDPAWQRCLTGEIDTDEYWNQLAHSGGYPDRISMWRDLSVELGAGVFADDALALVDEARAAGVKVGILSNDLYRSATREWVASRPEFDRFDVLVDCTEFGERKPAPGPYLKAAADFGLATSEIVFLDDTPYSCLYRLQAGSRNREGNLICHSDHTTPSIYANAASRLPIGTARQVTLRRRCGNQADALAKRKNSDLDSISSSYVPASPISPFMRT